MTNCLSITSPLVASTERSYLKIGIFTINHADVRWDIWSKYHPCQVHLWRLIIINQKWTLHHQLLLHKLVILFHVLYVLLKYVPDLNNALRFWIIAHGYVLLIFGIIILNLTLIHFLHHALIALNDILCFILLLIARYHHTWRDVIVCRCAERHVVWVHIKLLCVAHQSIETGHTWQIILGILLW